MANDVRPHRTSASDTGPLRVTILRDHIVWSGGTIHFVDLLPRLDPKRLAVRFRVLADPSPERRAFESRGIAPVFLPRAWHDPFAVRRIVSAIGADRPHLLHLSGPRAMLAGRLAGALTRTPSVLWFNNSLPEPQWMLWSQRRLAGLASAGIAVSKATADWAAQTYAVPRGAIEVHYSTPDLAPFLAADRSRRSRTRADLGIPQESRIVVLSGRLVDAQKGQRGMIDAFPGILARVPEAHLLVVGDGPDLSALRDAAAGRGLAHRVTFAGRRDDMPDILAASDVAVVPSRWEEAFGYVAIEASASGLPVVAFDVGGLPEAVLDRRTGLIVERNDWSALGDALVTCLTDPELASRLGRNGSEFAATFSIDAAAERFMAFHERLAGRTRGQVRPAVSP